MNNVPEAMAVYNKTAQNNQTNMVLVLALMTEGMPDGGILVGLGYLPSVASVAFSIAYLGEKQTLELLEEIFPDYDNQQQLQLAKELINLMRKCDGVFP